MSISEEWKTDSFIDNTHPERYLLSIARLHSKYSEWLRNETEAYRKASRDFDKLHNEVLQDYEKGPANRKEIKGWDKPARGTNASRFIVDSYVAANPEILKAKEKIDFHEANVDELQRIIKAIHSMGYDIRTYLDYKKFLAGV